MIRLLREGGVTSTVQRRWNILLVGQGAVEEPAYREGR